MIKAITIRRGEIIPVGSWSFNFNHRSGYSERDAKRWASQDGLTYLTKEGNKPLSPAMQKARLRAVGSREPEKANYDYICLIWVDEPEFNEWGEISP